MDTEIKDTTDTLEVDETTTDNGGTPEEELLKARELAQNQKIRAERAERELKEFKTQSNKSTSNPIERKTGEAELSARDVLALQTSGITADEDIETLLRFAKVEGKTLRDMTNDKAVMSLIKQNQELRASSEATSTGNDRRSTARVSTDRLLADSSKGIFPDSPEDIRRYVRAKMFGDKA